MPNNLLGLKPKGFSPKELEKARMTDFHFVNPMPSARLSPGNKEIVEHTDTHRKREKMLGTATEWSRKGRPF